MTPTRTEAGMVERVALALRRDNQDELTPWNGEFSSDTQRDYYIRQARVAIETIFEPESEPKELCF